MKEITVFGRGGQGAVVASEILSEAYFRQGSQVQSFPSFGVERRGAPVVAFVRVDREPIYLRSMIYRADLAVVLSAEVVLSPQFIGSIKEGAILLVNAAEDVNGLERFKVRRVDATAIALENGLGSSAQPMVNTAMLGALAAIDDDLQLEHVLAAVKDKVPQKIEANLAAVQQAFDSVITLE